MPSRRIGIKWNISAIGPADNVNIVWKNINTIKRAKKFC
jgi:hypothetical protein